MDGMAESRRLRVLVVHAHPGVRDRVVAALRNVPDLQVTGEAETLHQAREQLPLARPDVVLADNPAAAAALLPHVKAVELPAIEGEAHTAVTAEVHRIRLELLRRLQPALQAAASPSARAARPRVRILAIGASTGGPNALSTLVQQLPPTLDVPVVLVQHMPAAFVAMFAERLTAFRRIPFKVAEAGEPLLPGRGYIAPGDLHLAVAAGPPGPIARLMDTPPENRSRPAVDVLFRSVANVHGTGALALVLTGMGEDGRVGCEAIRAAGGQVVVQDEATSVVWGMPGAVAKQGLAHAVLPLDDIAQELVRRLEQPRR
jgi:two-component system chemotaxis response regulator CheB